MAQKQLNSLTAVIACKNRQTNISYCLASIHSCNPRPQVIVVDFGSAIPIKDFIPKYPWLKIIRVDRATKMFHKARALNIGIKNVKTKFLCITDADQIYGSNFFGVINNLVHKNPKSYVMCKTFFLKKIPEFFTLENVRSRYKDILELAKKHTPKIRGEGCCQATTKKWFMDVRGYEETFIGFSGEDSDVNVRSIKYGLQRIWAHKRTTMIHLPHPKNGKYYSGERRVANRNLYRSRARSDVILANINKKWGVL